MPESDLRAKLDMQVNPNPDSTMHHAYTACPPYDLDQKPSEPPPVPFLGRGIRNNTASTDVLERRWCTPLVDGPSTGNKYERTARTAHSGQRPVLRSSSTAQHRPMPLSFATVHRRRS
mmetsp:Transcript_59909/g.175098  ORF Transcript_59909/g.175098 Transcript_59909/m.175098 type:complete len:118 (-) Transcript_59909:387-740(-)